MNMAIQTPPGWGWDQLRHATHVIGSATPEEYFHEATPVVPKVRRIGVDDLRAAIAQGIDDFTENRTDVIFLCIIYPLLGLLLARLASGYDLLPLVFPLASGFALIGPLAAVGLNEMSRRRERDDDTNWMHAFGVLRSPSIGSIALLGALLVVFFLCWLAAAEGIFLLTLGPNPPVSLGGFVHEVFTTGAGWAMIIVGVGVGFLFAALVLAISVVSFPLMLDHNVGIDVAVATSLRAVAANPGVMALWGAIIAGALVLGSIPALLGLTVVMPVLGHATWHLYRRVVAA
jgi:uncharacterized membrane protein